MGKCKDKYFSSGEIHTPLWGNSDLRAIADRNAVPPPLAFQALIVGNKANTTAPEQIPSLLFSGPISLEPLCRPPFTLIPQPVDQ